MSYILLFVFFLFFSYYEKNNLLVKNESLNNNHLIEEEIISKNQTKRNLQANSNDSIRIYVDTNCLFQSLSKTSNYNISIFNKSINQAKETIENLINITRINKVDCSGLFQNDNFFKECVNKDILTKGVEADLVIFVRLKESAETKFNYAKSNIIREDSNNRPIIGTIVYNFLDLPENEDSQIQIISTIFLHQFTHLLGFNKTILMNKGIGGNVLVKNRITQNKVTKFAIIKPNIIEIARKYYNCKEPEEFPGIEMDDQPNDEGEENCHWNARLLLGEYMIYEIYYQEQIISEFTLAVLDSLGWYNVNYYTGGLMRFGKNKGCQFINDDCLKLENTYLVSSFPNEFCSHYFEYMQVKKFGTCSSGRQSMGYCYGNRNSDDLGIYDRIKYEDSFVTGFGRKFIEYCPLSYEVDEFDEENAKAEYFNGNCKIGGSRYGIYLTLITRNKSEHYQYNKFSEAFGENYSDTSFCALSSILKKKDKDNQPLINTLIRPTCYQMFCSDRSLTIRINNEYIVCPRNGSMIKVEGNFTEYEGYLFCPDFNLICTGTKVCNNMFDCVKKKSEIRNTTFDYDYSNKDNTIGLNINSDKNINENPIIGYEESTNGKCPINCMQCNSNKQCIKCINSYPNYVGTKENDTNMIECFKNNPGDGYYNTSIYRIGLTYFFKCIENCAKCKKGTEDKCDQCKPTHFLNNSKCEEERIPGCKIYDNSTMFNDSKRNANGPAYKECYFCDNSAGYYCEDNIRTKCVNLSNKYNNKSYYIMEPEKYHCVQKCEKKYDNCEECDKNRCTKCKNGFNFTLTLNHKCVEIINHCQKQDFNVDEKVCSLCEKGYYCIGDNIGSCNPIDDDIRFYYNISNSNNCIRRCNDTFPNCEECDNNIFCRKCKKGYFFYDKNKTCIKNITGCINNSYDGIIKECNECNMKEGYYCLNESKTECHYLGTNVESYYYEIPKLNFPCYKICDSLVKNCLKCNQTTCQECTKRYIVNNNGTFCFVKPFDVPDDDKCLVKYIPYNKSIYEIDPWDFADYYWDNIPYISIVDHYIGENYTITVFTSSECTEDLLNEGYYKIDSKELQDKMIIEAGIEGMKIIFSVFINYNHKNHFSYYDLETKYLNPNKYCHSCLEIDYNITNKFYNPLKDALGLVAANLITSEKIEFVDRDSDIYNDICKNVTFFGIDLPLKQRLKYLYLHNYTEQILCNSENCTLEEYDYENITTKCKCKIGNEFKDILKGENFQFIPYEGQPTELNNDFIDSLEIIKCALNGFKSKNIKSNIGFFISIIAIASQIALFIYYCLFSKSIVNINKNINVNISNPPKSKKNNSIMIISDWERIIRDNNKINDENEVYVQSRDDAEDQLLEEEKSYSKDGDIFDASSLSIDTNVGGAIRNISTGNKKNIKEKADNKRVLILLSNKGKNKSKNLQEDLISDSDIIPLEDNKKVEIKNFFKIYWYVLSLKQHIINYFSNINCCKITESYIPISIRLIRSIFIIILTFVLNILWLNQTYYENKFEYFNNEYKFIYTQIENKVPTGKRFSYAFSNTFVKGLISFAILLLVQFLIGFIFFSVRNNVIKAKKKNNDDEIEDVVSCTLKKYLLFFIINMTLMIIFLFSLTGFCGAYGGGFVDYFVASIISLILLEIFPFLWSIVIALFIYFGYKKNNKWLKKISHFFMF